jgi:hypothetical protein
MNKKYSDSILCVLVVMVFFFAGCNAPRKDLVGFNEFFRADYIGAFSFDKSAEFAESKISDSKNPKGEDLLWCLQLGSLERVRQNHQQSNDYFDKSEEMLNYFDYQNKTVDSAISIAVSENVIPYLGEEYDGIMVNTYKALNFMTLGDNELARVEFNRALDRQRRAKENFAQEIAKLKDELDQAEEKEKSQVKKNAENPEIKELIAERYPALSEFEAYPDFVNPFTTYIAGIFFNLIGDYSKSGDLIKESYGMVSDNEYVAKDMAVTEQVLDGQAELKDTVWVVFENGMGPIKEEFRIDIPLFVATDKIKYIGIALPELKFREQAYPYLLITAACESYKTQVVASMDRVIQTEFKKDFQGILTRAIISATAKAVAQYSLADDESTSGAIASVLMGVYTYATTAADVRIWSTLPKDFQVARLPMPSDRLVNVEPPGAESLQIEIPACRNALIYVRIPFKQAKAVYDVIAY